MAKKVSKPRIVKDYLKLPKEIQAAIKLEYPNGFSHKLISYTTPKGERVMALPFETEDLYYLVRVTVTDTRASTVRDEDDLDEDKPLVVADSLNLDELDLDGIKEQDDTVADDSDDDDDDDYVSPSKRRGRRNNEEDDDEDF